MSTFNPQCDAPASPPDPRKHVNYVQGMVLGADDLIQEFAYHQHQRHWLARDTIGYGTLSGLRVTFEKDKKVHVSPGTALSPRGQLIRVVPEQCAEINNWLDLPDTKSQIRDKKLGNSFPVYVVLCFNDCEVDELPVPGEPCRCEDQAKAPSRILDDFRLELRLKSPAQREEDAVRDFVQWLRQIPPEYVPGDEAGLNDFQNTVHNAAIAAAKDKLEARQLPSVYLSAAFGIGSPPGSSLGVPASPPGDLCIFLRTAFRLWVVELRPLWQAQWTESSGGCDCHADTQTIEATSEECLFLARLDLTLAGGQVESRNDVRVDDSKRPFVVHLRLLHEMIICGSCWGEQGGAIVSAGPPGPQGPPGSDGQNGKDGRDGADGKPGRPGTSFIVAAGRFDLTGKSILSPFNRLTAQMIRTQTYWLQFPNFDPKLNYIVKGMAVVKLNNKRQHAVEVLARDDDELKKLLQQQRPSLSPDSGIGVRIFPVDELVLGFMIEISLFKNE